MFVGIEFTREALELEIACSRLSDSGEDAKVKGTRSFFHVRAFLIPADSGADLGGGCRGCALPPPPRDDLRFSNTTGILQKKKLCGLLVLK